MFAAIVLALGPAQALGKALVRFVHAVPGAPAASLKLTGGGSTTDLGLASFAHGTAYRSVSTGSAVWKLSAAGKLLASGTATINPGAWTIVVLAKGPGVALGVYRDRGGIPGKSLLRLIHAAPELGSPNLELDRRIVATGVSFSQATPYAALAPGRYELAAVKPGASMPLVSRSGVTLVAGDATTAIVVGSKGQRTRIITLADRGAPVTAAPAPRRAKSSSPSIRAAIATVRRGDSLWSIARAVLGPGASNARIAVTVQRLWNINAARIGTHDPNLIFPGQRLRLR